MAANKKKSTDAAKSAKPAVAARIPAAEPISSTPVRNTPIPRPATPIAAAIAAPARKEITWDMIATRAYEISQSGTGGNETDNWFRAEQELGAI